MFVTVADLQKATAGQLTQMKAQSGLDTWVLNTNIILGLKALLYLPQNPLMFHIGRDVINSEIRRRNLKEKKNNE